MSDVTIPADAAKRYAAALLATGVSGTREVCDDVRELADLLDPQPVSLRERVAQAMFDADLAPHPPQPLMWLRVGYLRRADAALAVIADVRDGGATRG